MEIVVKFVEIKKTKDLEVLEDLKSSWRLVDTNLRRGTSNGLDGAEL